MTQLNSNSIRIAHQTLDVMGLLCPKPLLKTMEKLGTMQVFEILHVVSTDASSEIDFAVLARRPSIDLIATWREADCYHYKLMKIKDSL